MILREICKLVDGSVACGMSRLDERVEFGFASDLMSEVLTLKTDNVILITGLANIQSIRTVEMSDINYILLCRNRRATPDMIQLARENKIVIMESPYSLFKCSGLLYDAGLKAIY